LNYTRFARELYPMLGHARHPRDPGAGLLPSGASVWEDGPRS